jgi:hypothetical protein
MSITLNPLSTTFASGTFGDSTIGHVAGSLYPNAASRNFLRTGFIASSVTGFCYGGVGVTVTTQAAASPLMGPTLTIATAIANLAGFLVWDQSYAPVQTPNSPIPLGSAGMSFSFVEFGLGAQIALPISATNAANLLNVSDITQLTWDYTNQVLVPYTSGQIPGPSSLPAKIIDVQIGNSWVPVTTTNYSAVGASNPGSGNTAWYESGSVVVLQI